MYIAKKSFFLPIDSSVLGLSKSAWIIAIIDEISAKYQSINLLRKIEIEQHVTFHLPILPFIDSETLPQKQTNNK